MPSTILSANPETLTNVAREDTEKSTKEAATETVDKARDYANEKYEVASEMAGDIAKEVQHGATKITDAAHDFAVKQPVATAAGALAVGILLGMAINKRR